MVSTSSYHPSTAILQRDAAKARLQELPKNSDEHQRLTEALIKTSGIIEISLPHGSYKVNTSSCKLLGGFGSSEHTAIGVAVELKGAEFGIDKNVPLISRKDINVYYQDIVALAGDFYGVVNGAISLSNVEDVDEDTDVNKTLRFIASFETLNNADAHQLSCLLEEIHKESRMMRGTGLPHHCYSTQLMGINKAIAKIKPDTAELLKDNSDHFSANAVEAYQIGHAYAIKEAREAGRSKNPDNLKRAYALDAYACHFLTDLFSAGHIRNQRGALETFLHSQLEFSKKNAKLFAAVLTGAQHEKDGAEGLNVCNKKKEIWSAYGDGFFFTPKNETNKAKAIAAMQQSADEVYEAYTNPNVIVANKVEELIPSPWEVNPRPLYRIENNKLFVGKDQVEIKSRYDYITIAILKETLNYLPEEYVLGTLSQAIAECLPNIPLHALLQQTLFPPVQLVRKVFIPQIEIFTSTVWQVVGIATYRQSKKNSQTKKNK